MDRDVFKTLAFYFPNMTLTELDRLVFLLSRNKDNRFEAIYPAMPEKYATPFQAKLFIDTYLGVSSDDY